MACSPFQALCPDLTDVDETFEQFYPEESKCCVTVMGCRFGPGCQQTPPAERSCPLFYTDDIDLTSWTNKHPEQWGSREVLDWVYFVTNKFQIRDIPGEAFNRTTGRELCLFTRQQFLRIEPYHGGLLYECLQQLLRNSNFRPPNEPNTIAMTNNDCGTFWSNLTPDCKRTSHHCAAPRQAEMAVKLNGTVYDIDLKEAFVDIKEEPVCCMEGSPHEPPYLPPRQEEPPTFRDLQDPRLPSLEVFEKATELRTWRRSPGPIHKGSYDSVSFDGKGLTRSPPGRRPGHVSKGNHLWEFVRDLLANPVYNPSLVRWEDETNGVFRFVQSEKVAKLWGEKKNNSRMTYEKLSRSMRFCRSVGHFAVLPKSERFPKKLCFKFGPKAVTWRGS